VSAHPPYREALPDFHYDESSACCKQCGRPLDERDGEADRQLCGVCEPALAGLTRQVAELMGAGL